MSLEEMESEAHSLLQIFQVSMSFGNVCLSRAIYRTAASNEPRIDPRDTWS